jgi:hypothetical protein
MSTPRIVVWLERRADGQPGLLIGAADCNAEELGAVVAAAAPALLSTIKYASVAGDSPDDRNPCTDRCPA